MSLTVLLVDDEPMVVEELQESLEFEGMTVSTAGSVPDALSLCDKNNFDVIVTDLKMPGAGGLDLIKALRDRADPACIFVVSGHGAESNRTDAMSLGASECLAKPLDVDDLLEVIQQTLEDR